MSTAHVFNSNPFHALYSRSLGITRFWSLMGIITLVKGVYVYFGPDLFTEEAQYWLWSRHLDWAYYSKPPLIAYVNSLSSGLFGISAPVVRLNAVLCGLGISYFVFRLGVEHFRSHRVAVLGVVLLNVSPFFVTATLFFTTDSLLMLAWAGALRYFLRYTDTGQPGDGWRTAAFVVFGMLAKPTMVLFGFVVLAGSGRDIALITRRLLAFTIPVLVGLLPSLIWNYQHDWVTFRHIFTLAGGSGSSLLHRNALGQLLEFVGGQLAYGSIFIVAGLLLARPWKLPTVDHVRLLPLWLAPALILAGFAVLSVHKRVEVNWPSATLVAWPLVVSYLLHLRYRRWSETPRVAWPVGLSLATLLLILQPGWLDAVAGRPVLPVKADPLYRLAGWRQIGQTVDEFVKDLPPGHFAIVSDSYHTASELAFYVGGHPDTYCLPNANRRMNQFDFWPPPRASQQQNIVYVSEDPLSPEARAQLGPVLRQEVWPVYYRNVLVRTMYLYHARGYHPQTVKKPVMY